MKNVLYLLCVIILCTACSNDNGIKDASVVFELSCPSTVFDSNKQSLDVRVISNVDWEVSRYESLPEWLVVDKVDMEHFHVEVSENLSKDPRKYRVYFEVPVDSCYFDVTQDSKKYLSFKDPKEYIVSAKEDSLIVNVETNVFYEVEFLDADDWISNSSSSFLPFTMSNQLIFNIQANTKDELRKTQIVILNEEFLLSDTLIIEQMANEERDVFDGECKIFRKASKGAANLIIMGDGFIDEDLESGRYEDCMFKASEYFFSIEPYKSYQDYFNVYMVIAESQEEGVGNKNLFGESSINNKFGTAFGDGTEIVCNNDLILEYARKVKELPADKPITVLVVLNSTKYAGTAYLYADGNSIALCPMSAEESPNDFEGIVHHEAGGHAFGFLCDEYVYNQREIPEERKNDIREWQKLGYQMNLDFTDNLEEILWKDFIGIEKYAPVGAYEGGYEYQYGVWRSEENSCMNNNIPYYNVQSRWCIVNRIMQLSGMEYSVQDFISNDTPLYPSESRSLSHGEKLVPLGNPKWIWNNYR